MTAEAPNDGGPDLVWQVSARVLDLAVRLLGRVRVSGAEHLPRSGAALLVANHMSLLDPVVLLVVVHRHGRKVRFLSKQSLHDRPVVGWFLRAGRHIPVVQDAPSRAALQAAERALRAGELVLAYPEGRITDEGGATPKGGVGLLALRAGVPVVPLRSRGLARRSLRAWRPWRWLDATVTVGPPVPLPDVSASRGAARHAVTGSAVLAAVARL